MKNIVSLILLAAIIWGAYLLREQGREHRRTSSEEPPASPPLPAARAPVPTANPSATAARVVVAPTSTPAPPPTATPTPIPNPITSPGAVAAKLGLPLPEVLDAVVIVAGRDGAGTGFLCRFHNNTFVATNQHVLEVGSPLTLRTRRGEAIRTGRIFAATDADIALIECAAPPANTSTLEIATLPDPAIKKDAPTLVPGNSKGDGVVTQTTGRLLAIGPQRVEVDNPVYPGNSGSPIIDLASRKVIGVLTEVELVSFSEFEKASFRSKNSALKSTVRYFGHRIDSVQQWEGLDWNVFQQTEEAVKQSRKELDAMFAYFTESSGQYKQFKELHEAKNNAAKVYFDRKYSDADRLEAYNRFLRDVESLVRRAKVRVGNRKVYFVQKTQVETVNRMADLLTDGMVIARRDSELAGTLMGRGK